MIVTVNDENESWLDILTDFVKMQGERLRNQSDAIRLEKARTELAQEAAETNRRLAEVDMAELEAA